MPKRLTARRAANTDTTDLLRRIQRLAEVARLMGDTRTAGTMQAMADRLWQDSRRGPVPEETVSEARRLAA